MNYEGKFTSYLSRIILRPKMLHLCVWLNLFLLFGAVGFGQESNEKLDSLVKLYENKSKYFLERNWDSVEYYSKKGLELARKSNKPNKEVFFNNNLGTTYDVRGDFNLAKSTFNKSLKICRNNDLDSAFWGHSYRRIGNLFFYVNKADSAIANYRKALLFYKKDTISAITIKTNIAIAYCNGKRDFKKSMKILMDLKKENPSLSNEILSDVNFIIGNNFFYLLQHKKALYYYKKAQNNSLNTKEKPKIGVILGSIANIYGTLKKNDSSLIYFKKAKEVFKKRQDFLNIYNVNVNILQLFMNQKKYHNALKVIDEIEHSSLRKDKEKEAQIFVHKSKILFHQGKKQEAKLYSNKAVKLVENIEDRTSLLKVYMNNIKLFIQNEDVINQFNKYDSIVNKQFEINSSKIVNELETKYQTQQKENEILRLSNENNKQKTAMAQTRLLIAIILAVISVLALIAYFRWRKRKQEQQLEILEKSIEASDNEKNRIGRELHDGIASKIIQLANNAENLNTEYTQQLHGIYNEIRDLSHQLNKTPTHSNEPIFERILELKSSVKNQTVNLKIQPVSLVVREPMATHIYRIVQELFANNIKHANSTEINLNISIENEQLIFLYHDNGKGINTETLEKGDGFKNIEHRVSLMKGTILYNSPQADGFSLTIKMPLL